MKKLVMYILIKCIKWTHNMNVKSMCHLLRHTVCVTFTQCSTYYLTHDHEAVFVTILGCWRDRLSFPLWDVHSLIIGLEDIRPYITFVWWFRFLPSLKYSTNVSFHILALKHSSLSFNRYYLMYVKVKQSQGLGGPGGSRRLRLPDFKTVGTWRC